MPALLRCFRSARTHRTVDGPCASFEREQCGSSGLCRKDPLTSLSWMRSGRLRSTWLCRVCPLDFATLTGASSFRGQVLSRARLNGDVPRCGQSALVIFQNGIFENIEPARACNMLMVKAMTKSLSRPSTRYADVVLQQGSINEVLAGFLCRYRPYHVHETSEQELPGTLKLVDDAGPVTRQRWAKVNGEDRYCGYRPALNSPLVGTGGNGCARSDTNLDDKPRVADSDHDDTATIDIGPYTLSGNNEGH